MSKSWEEYRFDLRLTYTSSNTEAGHTVNQIRIAEQPLIDKNNC